MAWIIFSNGKRKEVSYNQAADIYNILNGTQEPKDRQQADFVDAVAEVEFDSPNKVKEDKPWERWKNGKKENNIN